MAIALLNVSRRTHERVVCMYRSSKVVITIRADALLVPGADTDTALGDVSAAI